MGKISFFAGRGSLCPIAGGRFDDLMNDATCLEANAMKYLCLVFYDEKVRNGLSDQDSQTADP